MKINKLFKKITSFITKKYYTSSSSLFVKYLRKNGIQIGSNCIFRAPKTVIIDMTRPYLISIGNGGKLPKLAY